MRAPCVAAEPVTDRRQSTLIELTRNGMPCWQVVIWAGSATPTTVTVAPTVARDFSDGSSKIGRCVRPAPSSSGQFGSTPSAMVPDRVAAADGSGSADGDAEAAGGGSAPESEAWFPAHPARRRTAVNAATRRITMTPWTPAVRPTFPELNPVEAGPVEAGGPPQRGAGPAGRGKRPHFRRPPSPPPHRHGATIPQVKSSLPPPSPT